MAALNPIFLDKNLLNDVSTITDNGTTIDTIKIRLFDRDIDLQYSCIGVTTGSRVLTITFGSSVTIDTIFIQNHNMQDFKIEYGGPAYFQLNPPGGPVNLDITGNSDTDSYYEVSSVNTTTVIITCTNIFGGVSGEMKIGELYIGTKRFEIDSTTGGDIDIDPVTSQSLLTLSDSTVKKLFVRRIVNYSLALTNITDEQVSKYVSLYALNRTASFAFVPRPRISHPGFAPYDTWLGLAGHYNWVNGLDVYAFTDATTNTFNVNIDLEQAGGLD